ncbi:MAG: hypothetical protein O9323_09605, partial [Microcystis sp. LE19-131.1A]|uniref:Calx-beta domain-containing protein n=1 Tax=Microcystis sp. LE19-131.1A TaxID=3016439 RepID=UPI0022C58A01
GNYAYVADYYLGLQIIDISNPAAPTLKGNYDTSGYANGVQVVGNYAYVADNYSGLQIIDISNPATPTLKGNYNTSGFANGVQIVGNYAYVADSGSGLQIIDISNPATPTLKGNYGTSGGALGVQVVGNYAYVADNYSGLQIIDISNPAAPTFKGNYDTSGPARDVQVVGNYAYVADGSFGLQIIDISNPAAPTLKGNYNTSGSAYDVQIVGNYAYVADYEGGLQILDVSDFTNPSTSTVTLAVSPSSVTEDGTANMVYTFTRSGVTTNPLTVNYTIGGTATNGTDYTSIPTSVTFAANSATATLIVDPTADTTVESNETVALTLATGTGYTVGTPNTATGTITNASATGQYASSVIAFSSQYSSSSWSAEQALGQPNTFDYGDIPTSWAPSTSNADGDTQADEFITVGFSTPVYADGIEIRETCGNGFVRSIDLLDNQGVYRSIWSGIDPSLPGSPVNFRVNFQPTNYLVVGAKINVDIDHDPSTWEEIDSVRLFGVGDVISNITLAVSPSSVTEDGTTNLVYTFTRSGVTTNALTVNYTLGGTATLNTDYTRTGTTNTVTFAANSSTATVIVDPTADTTVEPDETVILTLATGTGYTVGTTTPVTGTINNDDFSQLSINNITVVEGLDNNAILTVTVDNPNPQPITFNYTTAPINATANVDYTSKTGTLTIAPNTATATISIPILNDNLNEADEAFTVTLSNTVNATINPDEAIGQVIITDTLQSAITRTLPNNVENLRLIGTNNINGTG